MPGYRLFGYFGYFGQAASPPPPPPPPTAFAGPWALGTGPLARAPYSGLAFATALAPAAAADSILDDVLARLDATGLFEPDALVLAEPDGAPAPAGFAYFARVIPGVVSDRSIADGGDSPQVEHRGAFTLELTVRDDDPARRNRLLSRLCNAARNAVDNQSLAGATFPALTTLESSGRPAVAHPAATAVMEGRYAFVTDGYDFDDSFPD